MRILHVHTDLVGGGIEQMMTTLAAHTQAEEVGICWCPANHPEPPEATLQKLAAGGVKLTRIPPPFLSPRYPVRLARLIRRVQPEVLHLHGASVGAIGGLVGRMLRVPAVVYTEHLEHSRHAGWLRRARETTAGLPHWTVFVSQRGRQEAVEGGPLRNVTHRCSVIPNGIDLSPYAGLADTADRAEIRRELDLPSEAVVIGCVGLLWQAKGQEYLIRALRDIRSGERPVVLLLVGSGSDEQALRACAKETGVSERVRFLGWRSDVPRLLQALDLYVQPSLSEGFGLAVVEAAAAGLPIVASRVGGIPEIITHEYSGLLAPPGSPPALAAAIQELMDDPERGRWLGQNARRTTFERFSAEAMARAYVELYEALVARR